MSAMILVSALSLWVVSSTQSAGSPACAEWQDCRRLALDAAAREDYETFHTLAWRAVQTGPKNDPALMFLLARAQSLSGRPLDAFVMLERLAARGVDVSEANTSDDFRRVRALAAWQAAHGAGDTAPVGSNPDTVSPVVGSPPSPPGSGPPVPPAPVAPEGGTRSPSSPVGATPGAPGASASARPGAETGSAESPPSVARGLPIKSTGLTAVAMAYDSVSRRFVFADDASETLKVLDEVSGNLVNLVSRGWAGDYRTSAIAVDPRRGDLWVVGSDRTTAEHARSALHRVQLVSGRLLRTTALPPDAGNATFVDVAVTPNGEVLALDSTGGRIFRLASGARSLRVAARVKLTDATSLASADPSTAFVAHAQGLVRVNPASGASSPVRASRGVDLKGLQWIGWHAGSLVGIQQSSDGDLALVRIRLARNGGTATGLDVLEPVASRAAVIASGVLYYVAEDRGGEGKMVRQLRLR